MCSARCSSGRSPACGLCPSSGGSAFTRRRGPICSSLPGRSQCRDHALRPLVLSAAEAIPTSTPTSWSSREIPRTSGLRASYRELCPRGLVKDFAWDFKQRVFRKSMIGVHVRHGNGERCFRPPDLSWFREQVAERVPPRPSAACSRAPTAGRSSRNSGRSIRTSRALTSGIPTSAPAPFTRTLAVRTDFATRSRR